MGRKEVDRRYQGEVVVHLVDGSVVLRPRPYDQVGVRDLRQLAQHLRQVVWTKFRRSARAIGQAGQQNFMFSRGHRCPFPIEIVLRF